MQAKDFGRIFATLYLIEISSAEGLESEPESAPTFLSLLSREEKFSLTSSLNFYFSPLSKNLFNPSKIAIES